MKNLRSILAAAILASAGSQPFAADAVDIPTRYGPLAFNSAGVLSFKGRTVQPEVTEERFAMETPVARFGIGPADVFLFHQPRGNSCPGNFVFVSVDPGGARATGNFGTCMDEDIEPVQSGDRIMFSMSGMGGKAKSVYVYRDGVVTENGVRIK